jgi:hypothetical protein
MYAGAMTDAAPMATPPAKRQIARSHGENANPEPMAETAKSKRRQEHDSDAAVAIRHRTGEPGAHSRPQQRHRHDEARDERARAERRLDGVHSTVDDGGVEAEEEATDCGNDREEENATGMSSFDLGFRYHRARPPLRIRVGVTVPR